MSVEGAQSSYLNGMVNGMEGSGDLDKTVVAHPLMIHQLSLSSEKAYSSCRAKLQESYTELSQLNACHGLLT